MKKVKEVVLVFLGFGVVLTAAFWLFSSEMGK